MKKHYILGIFLLVSIFILLAVPTEAYATTINPSDDAYIDSYYPYSNYGASDYLGVGVMVFGGYCVTYLKFQIPASDRAIISATVSTYWYNYMCETWLTLRAGTTSNAWYEETITFDNSPYFYYYVISEAYITDRDHFNFEVKDYLPESGAFSIIIWEESTTGEYLQSDSKDNTLYPEPPTLTITYESKIEDFLPAIIGGTVGAILSVGAVIGFAVYYSNKKKRQRIELREGEELDKMEMVFCPKCNQRLYKGAKFCTECGNPL
ncbi:MAG: zinc ribbon domain-containing protein [Promethearchaeota archaeon]|nr:MAG: zinc ribbon domain-containing protein [Candidatus Lokiarchaeota archaeon]